MRVLKSRRVAGGYEVAVTHATKPGRSRAEQPISVFVAVDQDASDDELRAALIESIRDPFKRLRGQEVAEKPNTRLALEPALEAPYARWQRWKTTREEAQARALPAGVVTALTNREDAAWARYLEALTAWRQAP